MEEKTWSRRGWSGRCIVKSAIAEGVQFSFVIIFFGVGGGGVKCGQQQQQHQLYLHDYNYEVTVLQKL